MVMSSLDRKVYVEKTKLLLVTKVACDNFLDTICTVMCQSCPEVFEGYEITSKDVSDYIRTNLLVQSPDLHVEFVQTSISFFNEEFKESGKKYDSWQKAFAEAIDMACIYFCNCVGLEIEVNNVLRKQMVSILKS